MGTITLTDGQQRRSDILVRLRDKVISVDQACTLLGLSRRHVRRLLVRYRREGVASVVHGNRGRTPANKTPSAVRMALCDLAGPEGLYHDFNTCHLHEMLAQRDGVCIGRSTLDRLLVQGQVRKRRRSRPRRVYRQRDRCPRQGDMLLTDGSPYDWLEGRDPRYRRQCLLGSIDDATGVVVHLRLWPTECQAGYILMAREVVTDYGIPMRFYHDGHTILCSPKQATIEDELEGREPRSEFQTILALLGTEGIRALTPQAKGRVERLWRTLQDRLVKEMRLAGINTLEEANAFLPEFITRYNARFSVAPLEPDTAWVEAVDMDLAYYFAAREQRTVRADHTISWLGATLRIERRPGERSLSGTTVEVHTTPEGERFIYSGRQRLAYAIVPPRNTNTDISQTTASHDALEQPAKRTPRRKPSASPGTRAWLFGHP